jgi:AcrR family transcriptional regulator
MARRNLRNIDERILNRVIIEGAKNGIEGVSTKKIAAFLRITEPTIYVHFQSKKHLLDEAYHKAMDALYTLKSLKENDDFSSVIAENLYLIGLQAAKYPDEVIYAFNYRHMPDFVEANPAQSETSQHFFLALQKMWHHGTNENPSSFCPYIDRQIYLYALETVDSYGYSIAKKDLPCDRTTAKFFAALMLNALNGGKTTFLASLTDEDRKELQVKAADCHLLN